MLLYCKNCVMPDSRPNLLIGEDGICNACKNYENRIQVDWDKRYNDLKNILKNNNTQNNNWDCIVPVSGGKDSTYQVIEILKLDLKPLCVTSTTCDLSSIGRKNIENIKNLGVDYVELSPNPIFRRKLNYIGLTEVGDISWPEHLGIFTLPVRAAVQFQVPLIIWGENPENEYGGPSSASHSNVLNRKWLEEFGGLLGLRVSDLKSFPNINEKDLISYTYPSDEDLERVGVKGLFLGHYIPWDGLKNALISTANGFTSFHKNVEGSMVNYENLDNQQTGIHDYFKFLKFGFARTTDIASIHIRRNRITREDGMKLVKNLEGKFPWYCLDKPLSEIIKPLDMGENEFIKICDKFTNKKIFRKDNEGNLLKDKDGNLTKINYDN